jgi:hypothetical protein
MGKPTDYTETSFYQCNDNVTKAWYKVPVPLQNCNLVDNATGKESHNMYSQLVGINLSTGEFTVI